MFSKSLARMQVSTRHREVFIMKSYQHVLLAVGLFVALEYFLFASDYAEKIALVFQGFNWMLILGAYMLVAWGATRVAWRVKSRNAQYLALFVFVVAKAIIFVPLLNHANSRFDGVIESAIIATGVGFTGLTLIVFQTRKDFSFLGGFLRWGFFIALCLIIAAVMGWLNLGAWFSIAMIAFAGMAILYDTSNILHHYPETKYVSAGLKLFSSITLMLWYMIRALRQLGLSNHGG